MGVKLFVGNLSYQITELELREAFAQEGRAVQSVRIALDRETQRPRGFAFIEMATEADADGAIRQWNGQMLSGRAVFVEKAQERKPGERPPPRGPRPGGYQGGGPGGPGGGGYAPRPGGPGGPGGYAPRPGGPGGFRPGGPSGPPGAFRPRFNPAMMEPQKEEGRRHNSRPEKQRDAKQKKTEGRPEERERGKWRWDGNED